VSGQAPQAAQDPIEILKRSPMSGMQWAVVAVMFGLNALDGFDALAISFAAPGILAQWGLTRAALGVVMSLELVGMTLGSLLLGGLADARGRRWTILLCLACMSTGMFGSAFAPNVALLSIGRVLTGFGIGGMLAATNAGVAEAANERRRPLVVVLMAVGFPIGSVLGGVVAVQLLRVYPKAATPIPEAAVDSTAPKRWELGCLLPVWNQTQDREKLTFGRINDRLVVADEPTFWASDWVAKSSPTFRHSSMTAAGPIAACRLLGHDPAKAAD